MKEVALLFKKFQSRSMTSQRIQIIFQWSNHSKASSSLLVFDLKVPYVPLSTVDAIADIILPAFTNLIDLRVGEDDQLTSAARLVRENPSVTMSSLQVVWWPPTRRYCIKNPNLFQTLVSSRSEIEFSHKRCRTLLDSSARTLKDLRVKLSASSREEVPLLEFPSLELLNLFENAYRFPAWMKVNPSLKLNSAPLHFYMPSISQYGSIIWWFELVNPIEVSAAEDFTISRRGG